MSRILAIDPGNEISGWVIVEDGKITESDNTPNAGVLNIIKYTQFNVLAIEWISSYGMPVGKTTFETCLWVGRFSETANRMCKLIRLIPRMRIKHHHTGRAAAKDSNVKAACEEKYGVKGTKANPGYFYGVSKHAWQAFAVAAYVMEGAEHESEILL